MTYEIFSWKLTDIVFRGELFFLKKKKQITKQNLAKTSILRTVTPIKLVKPYATHSGKFQNYENETTLSTLIDR